MGKQRGPTATVSATLGDFIRNGDTRVKRIKQEGGTYSYYLTKNKGNIGIDVLTGVKETVTAVDTATATVVEDGKLKKYYEKDLHKLLSSYLKNHTYTQRHYFPNNQHTAKTAIKSGHTPIWLVFNF